MQQVIDQQAVEIEALRARLVDDGFAQELRHALIHAAAAGAIAAPLTHSRLLEMLVQTSMQVVSAEAAALFLVDDRVLSVEVACGPHAATSASSTGAAGPWHRWSCRHDPFSVPLLVNDHGRGDGFWTDSGG